MSQVARVGQLVQFSRRSGRSQVAMLAVALVIGLAAVLVIGNKLKKQPASETIETEVSEAPVMPDPAVAAAAPDISYFDHDISLMDAKNKAINSNGKDVLLYFTATWCPPCKLMKSDVLPQSEVRDAITSRYVPVYIDIDKRPEDARKYGISSIPAFVITRKGEELSRRGGFQQQQNFVEWLKESR
ncbi:MAG: thioredoxin family protein [Phycisphaerae bacterium]|jgi:thioredoxin 1